MATLGPEPPPPLASLSPWDPLPVSPQPRLTGALIEPGCGGRHASQFAIFTQLAPGGPTPSPGELGGVPEDGVEGWSPVWQGTVHDMQGQAPGKAEEGKKGKKGKGRR